MCVCECPQVSAAAPAPRSRYVLPNILPPLGKGCQGCWEVDRLMDEGIAQRFLSFSFLFFK